MVKTRQLIQFIYKLDCPAKKGLYLKAGIVQIIDQYIGLFLYPPKYEKRPMYWSIQITQGRQSDFRLNRLRHIVMTTYL